MLLIFKRALLEAGASHKWVQAGHRRTAIEYAIAGTKLVYQRNVAQFEGDAILRELEGVMPAWVVETIAQGAYIREYHIWEKEVKDYLSVQMARNGLSTSQLKAKAGESLIVVIQRILAQFTLPDISTSLRQLDDMREKVNVAKHDPGVLVEHFVSIEDYWSKLSVIEGFWEVIAEHEVLVF